MLVRWQSLRTLSEVCSLAGEAEKTSIDAVTALRLNLDGKKCTASEVAVSRRVDVVALRDPERWQPCPLNPVASTPGHDALFCFPPAILIESFIGAF